ncbi:protein FAM124A [Grus japonensis]|uniref:Protein FAM124A n=1 Tax=Grus japonensis TaxID=30415 RepID=A0ABC9W541_GRUJA
MEQQPGGEDDCVDSGAETGGSEYSRMSSTSSELSVEGIQDPFLVSVHIITDPGESKTLQQAIDKLLAWIHPDLQLFRVSERRVPKKRRKPGKAGVSQPALAIILFLQEEYGEEPILQLHETFQRPPWHYHHTERVHGKFLPYMPCSQDFYTLAPETPLWAIRPVHYGKEIIRFTIYCRSENFVDILKLYELILKRPICQKKADFCVFPVYSNMEIDIQFSLKKLPKGQVPMPTESAVLEFRVKDVGQLVPLLPNPCSPISEGRWQTEDHDGNRILLQVQMLKTYHDGIVVDGIKTNLWRKMFAILPGKWTTVERGIQYLRELAVWEMVYYDLDSKQFSTDPDEIKCMEPMWRKLVRSTRSSYMNSLAVMTWKDGDGQTVNEVAGQLQQYEESFSSSLVTAVEKLLQSGGPATQRGYVLLPTCMDQYLSY